jgi:hypothetical protein
VPQSPACRRARWRARQACGRPHDPCRQRVAGAVVGRRARVGNGEDRNADRNEGSFRPSSLPSAVSCMFPVAGQNVPVGFCSGKRARRLVAQPACCIICQSSCTRIRTSERMRSVRPSASPRFRRSPPPADARAGGSRSLRMPSARRSRTAYPCGIKRRLGLGRKSLKITRRRDRFQRIDDQHGKGRNVATVSIVADAARNQRPARRRHIGTSAPSPIAQSRLQVSPAMEVRPTAPASPSSVAAASAEPPPMPEATGRFFCR